MEKIVDYNDISIVKPLGSGCNSTCYLTTDNHVFKRFNNPKVFENNLKSICGLHIPTYVFPQSVVTLESTIIGYIMEYVEGVKVQFLNKQISLEEYLNALRIAEQDTLVLSNLRIHSFDLKSETILYTPDGKLKIIDTDFYYKVKSIRDLYTDNMGALSFGTMDILFNMYATRFKTGYLESRRGDLIDGKISPSHYIEFLLHQMRISNIDGMSVEDMSNEMKLLYRK